MQRRARCGGVELEVFKGTRYFAGPVTVREPGGVMIQVKVTLDMKHMEESIQDLGLGGKSKSNIATFLGSLLCPLASFGRNPLATSSHMNQPASSTRTSGSHDEPPQLVSSLSSSFSRGSCGIITAAAVVCGRDLGEVVGDRRLQGVRVVKGAGVGEETWVVRCGGGHALEEEEHHVRQKTAHAASGAVQGSKEDDDDCGSDSDTSSDLFELDLKDANNH